MDSADQRLRQAATRLKLDTSPHSTVVFVYSAPKVGSTSLVSSLRLFGAHVMDILHIHDEQMLQALTGIQDVRIVDLIEYVQRQGKRVFVLNIFRTPIERKISAFFEKVGTYHFGVTDAQVNTYPLDKVLRRFHRLCLFLGNGDHFLDIYPCAQDPAEMAGLAFDHARGCAHSLYRGVHYVSLRLQDSHRWGDILTSLFGFPCCAVRDYESTDKPIRDLYRAFRAQYRVPHNLLTLLLQQADAALRFYLTEAERAEYLQQWRAQSLAVHVAPFSPEQYAAYVEVSNDNTHLESVQTDHYLDEGCVCKACSLARYTAAKQLLRGETLAVRIVHAECQPEK